MRIKHEAGVAVRKRGSMLTGRSCPANRPSARTPLGMFAVKLLRVKWLWALLVVGLGLSVGAQSPPRPGATAELRAADGQPLATATFTQAADQVLISIAFRTRTALTGTHAIQLHSVGQCTPPTFDSAGPIFNPTGRQHGLQNPDGPMAGDLPNLVIGPAGVAVYNLSAPLVTIPDLLKGPGTALVIFAQPDDDRSPPEGNAGQRIACGVIRGTAPSTSLATSIVIGVMGGLLVAGGVVLRRGA
jgi:Cu-Zn family superoxide dismutase